MKLSEKRKQTSNRIIRGNKETNKIIMEGIKSLETFTWNNVVIAERKVTVKDNWICIENCIKSKGYGRSQC